MHKRSVRWTFVIALATALSGAGASSSYAQDKKTDAATTVTGTWNMSLQGDHVVPVGLVLEQDGKKVTGTLMLMGTDVPIAGEFVDGRLTLTANASVLGGPAHGAPAAAGAEPAPTKLSVDGKMQDDGTLAGKFATPRGAMSWTAERFKQRTSIAGNWNMSVNMHDSKMSVAMVLKRDGAKVTGTLVSEHTGTLNLEGTFVDGTLKFSTTSLDGNHLDYTAKLKDEGMLAGQLSGPQVPSTPWTAERAKK